MPRALLLTLAVLLLLPAAAHAQSVVDDNVAATSSAPGRLDVAARAADGTIVYRSLDIATGVWSPWEAVRGIAATSGPALAADDDGILHVYARMPDGSAGESVRSGSGWSAWTTVTPSKLLTGPGASNRQGTSELDSGVLGLDGAFFHTYQPAPGQPYGASYARIGSAGTSAPGMVSRGPSMLDAFFRAADGSVVDMRFTPGVGWAPTNIGGTVLGAISPISRAGGQMDIYARGFNDRIYGNTFDGANWVGFTVFENTAGTSAPAAATTGGGRVDMVVRDGTTLYHRFYDGQPGPDIGGWKNFAAVGPIEAPVDRGALNGTGGGDGATLTAAFGAGGKTTRTFKLGKRVAIGGVLRNAAGAPVSGGAIQLLARFLARGSRDRVLGTATTDANGFWVAQFKAGPGVRVTARYVAFANDAAAAATTGVRARTKAVARLNVSRKRVRPGQRLTFNGRLRGGAVPRKGKLVALQARERGRWRTFANPRAGTKGRFRARYRFQVRPSRSVRFRFRAVVPTDAAYPFTRGVSNTRTVTLRP